MPRSPLTWFIALGMVLLYAAGLFMQVHGGHYAIGVTQGTVVILATLLGFSAVRDAPAFCDRAFHRTLPPGDGAALRSILAIHGLVLGGIAAVTAVYCGYLNFGWETFLKGIVLYVAPLGLFMILFGIGASIATSPGKRRMLGFVAALVAPIASIWVPWWLLLDWSPSNGKTPSMPAFYLLMGVVYLLIWWLVAVRRRKTLGMVLAGIYGLGLPWIPWILGEFGFSKEIRSVPVVISSARKPVEWHRKNTFLAPSEWFPVSKVLDITGLQEGEIARMKISSVGKSDQEAWVSEVSSDGEGVQRGTLDAGAAKDGSLRWGRAALLNSLRERLPPLEELSYLDREGHKEESSELSFHWPGYDEAIAPGRRLHLGYTLAEFMNEPWTVSTSVFRYELVGDVDVSKGGNLHVPSGGRVFVRPMRREKITRPAIGVTHCFPGRDESRIWTYQEVEGPGPMVVIVNESGSQAFAFELVTDPHGDPGLWLGSASRWISPFKEQKLPRLESFGGGRLYVFLPKLVSQAQSESLPSFSDSPR